MGSHSSGTTPAVPFVPLAPESRRSADHGPTDLSQFGPLAPYVGRAGVTDVFVNGAELWCDGDSGVQRLEGWSADERATRELAVRLIGLGGRHVDEATPFIDVRLAGGIRVHAVLPPISTSGTLLSIRVPRPERLGLGDLVSAGSVSSTQSAILRSAIARRLNLLVTGAAGAGKTTLLAAMLAEAPPHERIVLIEDVAELRVDHPHVVGLQARQSNLEGAGGVGLQQLVREALRMRPDRLVLGECRGAEVQDLLSALNTGHDGGAGTLHANSLADVPARLEALGVLAGMPDRSIARQAVSAIGLVIHVARQDGARGISGFGRLRVDDRSRLMLEELRMPDGS